MVKFIYQCFYGLPLSFVIQMMILGIIVWTILGRLVQEKLHKRLLWKVGNGVIVCGILVTIGGATLASRSNTTDVCLIPFHSFAEAQVQPEIYRSMLMNVFLFFPLGLTLPYALPDKWKHQIVIAILFAFGLSVAIEFLQYYFCLGRAETDDVICNTLGCIIGTLSFKLENFISKKLCALSSRQEK